MEESKECGVNYEAFTEKASEQGLSICYWLLGAWLLRGLGDALRCPATFNSLVFIAAPTYIMQLQINIGREKMQTCMSTRGLRVLRTHLERSAGDVKRMVLPMKKLLDLPICAPLT